MILLECLIMNLKACTEENIEILKEHLPIGRSFDVVGRELIIGQRKAYLVFVDGFAKDDVML